MGSELTCPFCGGPLEVYEDDGEWGVTCDECSMDAGYFGTREEMERTFRRRAALPELMPCPLCGGTPKLMDHGHWWVVRCEDCLMDLGRLHSSRQEAANAWNVRNP